MTAVTFSPLFPPTFTADAERVTAQLREVSASLWTRLSWNSWRLPDSVVGGVKTALRASEARIASLAAGGEAWARVIRGEKSAAWWAGEAASSQATLTGVGADLGAALPTWARLRAEVIAPTAAQVGELASTVADKAGELGSFLLDYWPWVLAAAAALVVGLFVLRVL